MHLDMIHNAYLYTLSLKKMLKSVVIQEWIELKFRAKIMRARAMLLKK